MGDIKLETLLEPARLKKIRILPPEEEEGAPALDAQSRNQLHKGVHFISDHPFWIFMLAISIGVLSGVCVQMLSTGAPRESIAKPKIADYFLKAPLILHSEALSSPEGKPFRPLRFLNPGGPKKPLEQTRETIRLPQVKPKNTDLITTENTPSANKDELDILMSQLKNLNQVLSNSAKLPESRPKAGNSHVAA